MKWEIFHRTRYTYATPVRDSFNDVRLQPMPIPEQTVDSFLLRVLPAARLTHFKDFYSNWVNHFELIEPHGYLMIEASSRVTTHPPAPLPDEPLCPFDQMRGAGILRLTRLLLLWALIAHWVACGYYFLAMAQSGHTALMAAAARGWAAAAIASIAREISEKPPAKPA